jgi:anthranilate synthase/aminodeoxychorismate synthase-like glutamine amidotransferase
MIAPKPLLRKGYSMFILIDNYDSFTWNLWHFLSDLGAEVEIIRNDASTPHEILAKNPQGIVISPGPGTPEDAGMTIDLIRACFQQQKPLLGVCLGHQALAAAFGGHVNRIDPPVHGKLSRIVRTRSNAVESDIFALCPDQFPVTRYHSLVVEEKTLPSELTITARTEAGAIMGLSHSRAELHGVQFHPESIASVAGYRILAKFLEICGHNVIGGDRLGALEAQILRLDERFPGQMHD